MYKERCVILMTKAEIEVNKMFLKQIIKSHTKFIAGDTDNILGDFHFEISQDMLNVYSSDGYKALKSTVEINNISKNDVSFTVNGEFMKNLMIISNVEQALCICLDENEVIFTDKASGTVQKCMCAEGIFPKVQKLLDTCNYNDKNYKIIFNKKFFKDLDVLYCDNKTPLLRLNFNKEDPLKPIIAFNCSQNLKQTAILIPVQVKE